MKSLTFCLLGLVSIPACLSIRPKDKHCFSESLNPSYPCCQGDIIVYTDDDGDWGVENNEWCGIGGIEEPDESCFSIKLGYPCCKDDKIIFSDERGDWGKEDKQWCGIGNGPVEEPIETPTEVTPEETPTEESPEETTVIEIPIIETPIVETPTEETPTVETTTVETPFYNPNLPCNAIIEGYPCCRNSCDSIYTDITGSWNIENGDWCGVPNNCFQPVVKPIINMTAEIEKIENSDVVGSNNQFEFTFLKLENNKKNMIYSPLSIEYALKMLLEGAEGKTYDEIIEVLGEIELPKYDNIDKNLSSANGLFIKEKYYEYVKASYMELLQAKYNAEVVQDEFKDAKNINQWIDDKTLGIIKNVISDKIVQDDDNVMFLINALAIDMEWEDQFSDRRTIGSPFYKDDGEEIMATTLRKTEVVTPNLSYYLDDEITVLTMLLKNYNGTQLEFMAIMPKENLSAYVENITKTKINIIDKYLMKGDVNRNGVNVKIPKFKFNYNLELKKGLQELGVKESFERGVANFKKMSDAEELEDLFVSDAIHKADIEFSEDGIKAAAVTVFVMGGPAAPMPEFKIPVDVIIDKPFMFLIRDVKTKDIWFTGTVYEPNLWENEKNTYNRN